MDGNPENSGSEEESFEDMIQHLEIAKQRDRTPRSQARQRSSGSGLQDIIQRRTDAAILASNFEVRLEEIENNDAVTHRSSKRWKSAKVGVEAHGRLPIYYRLNGKITHKGYISDIILDPDSSSDSAEKFIQHITNEDTYDEYNDQLDTTTYIIRGGERLDSPFSQSNLKKLSGDGPIDEDYSYQPAYVVQRPGDFPDFP